MVWRLSVVFLSTVAACFHPCIMYMSVTFVLTSNQLSYTSGSLPPSFHLCVEMLWNFSVHMSYTYTTLLLSATITRILDPLHLHDMTLPSPSIACVNNSYSH
jgi:hypothetical protein